MYRNKIYGSRIIQAWDLNSETISGNHHWALVYHHGTSHLQVSKKENLSIKYSETQISNFMQDPNSGQLITESLKKLTSGRVQFADHSTLANTMGIWIANLFDIQIMGICLIIKWFAIQMPSTMVVRYSDQFG